jgi:hypothetical protein
MKNGPSEKRIFFSEIGHVGYKKKEFHAGFKNAHCIYTAAAYCTPQKLNLIMKKMNFCF